MKNKRRLKILALTLLATFTSATLVTSAFAWFSEGTNITFDGHADPNNVPLQAGAESSYFYSGDGSSDNPFVIKDRIHLYNLAWLQYIGYFDGSDTLRPLQPYFVLHDSIPDSGLDMSGITLPPIGTNTFPFIGSFNGKDKTITNLTVSNDDPTQSSSDFGVMKPSLDALEGTINSEIIGFFGVVGTLPNQTITNYSSSVVSISNLSLHNLTVKSTTNQTLIGLAAGYVDGLMSGVRVSGNAKLDLGTGSKQIVGSDITNNVSDYGLVGYSTQSPKSIFSQSISEYYASDDPNHGGDNWGGSVDIRKYNISLKLFIQEIVF